MTLTTSIIRIGVIGAFLLVFVHGQFAPVCSGGTLPTADTGVLAYPATIGNGDSFPYNLTFQCDWVISVTPGQRVAISFAAFNTYATSGPKYCPLVTYLSIFDGPSAAAPKIGELCDTAYIYPEILPSYVSNSDTITVRFGAVSGFINTGGLGAGFILLWNATTNSSRVADCFGFVDLTSQPNGVLQNPSPNANDSQAYLHSVQSFSNCSYLLMGTNHVRVMPGAISVSSVFAVGFAKMCFYDGRDASAPIIGCTESSTSQDTPPVYASSQPYMFVKILSTNGNYIASYRVAYMSVDQPEYCINNQEVMVAGAVSLRGTVQSPTPYVANQGHPLNITCYFSISGDRHYLNVTAIDMPDHRMTIMDGNCRFTGFIRFDGQATVGTLVRIEDQQTCIVFQSGLAPGSGFRLDFWQYDPVGVQCQNLPQPIELRLPTPIGDYSYKPLYSIYGILADPSPQIYRNTDRYMAMEPGDECTWHVSLVQVIPDPVPYYQRDADTFFKYYTQLSVYFRTLLLPPSIGCKDVFIEIFDGPNSSSPLRGRFCSAEQDQIDQYYYGSHQSEYTIRLRSNISFNITGAGLAIGVPAGKDIAGFDIQGPGICTGNRSIHVGTGQYWGTFYPNYISEAWLPDARDYTIYDIVNYQDCVFVLESASPASVFYVDFLEWTFPPADPCTLINDTVTIFDGAGPSAPVLTTMNYATGPINGTKSNGPQMAIQLLTGLHPYIGDDAKGFRASWRVSCPDLFPSTPWRTVTRDDTTMTVTCAASTPCPGTYTSTCDSQGFWQPTPPYCYSSCIDFSLVLPNGSCSYDDSPRCRCDDQSTHQISPVTEGDYPCVNETYYGQVVVCPAMPPQSCEPITVGQQGGLLNAITISPELLPLRGGSLTISGTGWSMPVVEVRVNEEIISDVTAITSSAQDDSVSVTTGPHDGYATVSILDSYGNVGILANQLFFTDDCPTPGTFGKGGDCHPCPVGGQCPGGNRIWPLAGYWNEGEASGYVTACSEPATDRCLGGRNSTCGASYTGVACAKCFSGYYDSGVVCQKCPAPNSQIALYVVTAFLFFALSAAIVILNDGPLGHVVNAFKLLQAVRIAGVRSGAALPDGMRYINDYLTLITFDYNFLQPSCGQDPQPASFSRIFWGNAVVIVILVAPSLIMLGMLAVINNGKRRTHWVNRMFRALFIFASLTYYIVATRTLTAITCISLGEHSVLQVDPDEKCKGSPVVILGAIGVVFITLGVPGAVTTLLTRLWRTGALNDEERMERYHQLLHTIRTTRLRFFYESAHYLQLFLLALAWSVFPTNGASAFGFAIFAYAATLIVVIVWRPQSLPRGVAFAVISNGLGLTSTVANLMTLHTNAKASGAAIGVVVALLVVTLLLAAGVYLYERRAAKKEGKSDAGKETKKDKEVNVSLSTKSSSSTSSTASGEKSA